jgi:hypothetical protein
MNNQPSAANLPAAQVNPGQTAQDAIMQRIQPLLNQQQDRMNNQLANQGIQSGSEADLNAQRTFGNQANDAYSQAALNGINVGQQARQQALTEQNYYATQPLNFLNALRTGAQVQSPTFGSTPAGPNYTQAAQNTYAGNLNTTNASNASNSNFLSGLFNLGSSALLGNGSYSDIRLKSNIVRVGTHPRGFGVYEYDIFGRRERGVIAQEVAAVMPEAVTTAPDGFLQVFYGML